MIKLQKTIALIILLTVFLPVKLIANYTWIGNGQYQIGGGPSGYPNTVEVNTFDTVSVIMLEGGGVHYFNMYDSSHLAMYSGDIGEELNLYDNATASLFGASYIGQIWVDAASTGWVKFYANNVTYDQSGIFGNWLSDGKYFQIDFSGDTYLHVQIVPEPATLALLTLGGLAIFRHKKR